MTQDKPTTLPKDGMSRISQILPFLPIGKSTVWAWVKAGKFPPPIKLSATVTVWRNSDIHQWLNEYSA
ncbi:AlpA family phage regulatory protein [Moraxella haemolytica]|uniref:helix-turn-helix transcriptional regulator n=1 Tax=Moraxella haemolytica TaxID=2904119 RepID=UPI002543C8DF|nr:AlpA family phage regulatory protein [Moraxella sp. ZY171148]WII94569.1 AlpA family phage regulatory protein [Moraxella sp. ZY171148]